MCPQSAALLRAKRGGRLHGSFRLDDEFSLGGDLFTIQVKADFDIERFGRTEIGDYGSQRG